MNLQLKYIVPRKVRALLRSSYTKVHHLYNFLIARTIKKLNTKSFKFNGVDHNYFLALYNTTYQNERAIEIPIILDFFKKFNGEKVLEIGNVMNHYFHMEHVVVDKYEKEKGVLNCDIIDYEPNDHFDFIFSISTFEHIGFDEVQRYSSEKNKEVFQSSLLKAFEKTKTLLKDNGMFVFTVPYGFNTFLDAQVEKNQLLMSELYYLKRIYKDNEWKQVTFNELEGTQYGQPYSCANGMIIGIFKKNP